MFELESSGYGVAQNHLGEPLGPDVLSPNWLSTAEQTTASSILSHMANEPTQETQKTQPKKGEPIEIPVPSKDQIVKDFEKIVSKSTQEDGSKKTRQDE